jgi:hypothetical protein
MIFILIGYMFLFIHRPFEVWPVLGDYHIERIYVFFAAAVWAVWPGKSFQFSRLDLLIGLFCTAIVASWMMSPWSDGCQPTVEDYFKIVVFYILFTTVIHRPEQLRLIVLAFLFIMAVYMLHSLWEYRNGRMTFRMGISRMVGVDTSLGDPNSFGATIVYALPFVRLFWLTAKEWWMKYFLAGYFGLSVLCILLTGSRSSFVGLILCVLIFSLQSRRRFTWLALGSVLACGAFFALPDSLQTRFETIINPEVGPENARVSGQGRIEGIINGIALIEKYPISGCGPGVWRKATGSTIESHNLYGQVMGELGAIGVVTFGALVLVFVQRIWMLRRRCAFPQSEPEEFIFHLTSALATAVFLMLFEGMFGHNLLRFSWLWYIGFLVIALKAVKYLPRGPFLASPALQRI